VITIVLDILQNNGLDALLHRNSPQKSSGTRKSAGLLLRNRAVFVLQVFYQNGGSGFSLQTG